MHHHSVHWMRQRFCGKCIIWSGNRKLSYLWTWGVKKDCMDNCNFGISWLCKLNVLLSFVCVIMESWNEHFSTKTLVESHCSVPPHVHTPGDCEVQLEGAFEILAKLLQTNKSDFISSSLFYFPKLYLLPCVVKVLRIVSRDNNNIGIILWDKCWYSTLNLQALY